MGPQRRSLFKAMTKEKAQLLPVGPLCLVVDSGRSKQTLSENTTATDTSCRGLSGRVGLFKPANSRHPRALKITPQWPFCALSGPDRVDSI